jgi:transcriptional regulator GlxA family with amidase domain
VHVVDAIAAWAHSGVVAPHRIVFAVFPGVQPLDLVGPQEVFAGADSWAAATGHRTRYQLLVAGPEPGPVRAESGLGLHAEPLPPVDEVDTLVVPGGNGVWAAAEDEELVAWIAEAGRRARRVATVCTGTALAAAAGLLDGRRVTTHWARAERLARDHPELTVDADPIWIRDGRVWTSAGVTSGIDLALALVEDDLGREAAQVVARWLVVFLRRSGGQSQFASPVWSEPVERAPIRAAQELIHTAPAADLSVPALARHAGLSARHFTRLFHEEMGEPPGRYVERVRVGAARGLLEEGTAVESVARRCGFGTAESLRRAFHRQVGVSPAVYRDRFAAR